MSFGHWCNGEAGLPLAGWAGTGKMGGRNRQRNGRPHHFLPGISASQPRRSLSGIHASGRVWGLWGSKRKPKWCLGTLAFVHQCTLTPWQPRRAHSGVVARELVPQGTVHKVPAAHPSGLMFSGQGRCCLLRRRWPCPPPMAGRRKEGDRSPAEVFELMDLCRPQTGLPGEASAVSTQPASTSLDLIYPRSPQSTRL